MQPYYALWRNQSVFDPRYYNPANAPTVDPVTDTITGGDPYNGVVIPGSGFPSSARGHVPDSILNGSFNRLFHGTNPGYSNTIWTDIQPRVGFTYQVGPTTVVRGGGGRFVQRIGISDAVQLGWAATLPSSPPPPSPAATSITLAALQPVAFPWLFRRRRSTSPIRTPGAGTSRSSRRCPRWARLRLRMWGVAAFTLQSSST